jgi:hypothetical protein
MKKNVKKLTLARETVRNLDMSERNLKGVEGGIISSDNLQCTYSQRCATKLPNCA